MVLALKIYPLTSINNITDIEYDVLIDTREQIERSSEQEKFTTELMEYFDQMGITYKRVFLPMGDYIINRGKGMVIEMKSIPDLISSMTGKEEVGGKRLTLQLQKFKNYDILPKSFLRIFLVRGGLNLQVTTDVKFEKKQLKTKTKLLRKHNYTFKYATNFKNVSWKKARCHPNAFVGFINKIERNAKYIPTGDRSHTFDWFRLQLDKAREYEKFVHKQNNGEELIKRGSMRTVKRNMSDTDKIHSVLEGFIKVGPVYTVNAMKIYKNLRNLFTNVTEDDLVNKCGWNRLVSIEFIRLLDNNYSI